MKVDVENESVTNFKLQVSIKEVNFDSNVFSKVRLTKGSFHKGLFIIDFTQKLTPTLEFTLGGVYRRFWVGQRERYLVLRNQPGAGSSSHGLRTGRLFLTTWREPHVRFCCRFELKNSHSTPMDLTILDSRHSQLGCPPVNSCHLVFIRLFVGFKEFFRGFIIVFWSNKGAG